MANKPTALITGASGGIGFELANVFAQHGYDLVLVARSVDKLNQLANDLKTKHGTQSLAIGKDLTALTAPDEIYADLQRQNVTVDVLVNNAGFANYGNFTEIAIDKELQLLQLNILALTYLTKLFLPGMKARHSGKILNIASTAAFMPGPLMATYYASKAYVLSFSEALAAELKGSGVTVTALCPGKTESGFQERAAMQDVKLVQSGLMSAAIVAQIGYAGMVKGQTVVIPGIMNRLTAIFPRFVPREMAAQMVMKAQGRVPHQG